MIAEKETSRKYKYKILILIAIGAFLVYIYASNFSFCGNRLQKISINGKKFRAEAVSSLSKREQGLGGRKKLCEKCAMLFVFPEEGRPRFWMKNMNFDLDIIWIKGDEIADISENISRDSSDFVESDAVSDKVLEINAGLSRKYGFKKGDRVSFE